MLWTASYVEASDVTHFLFDEEIDKKLQCSPALKYIDLKGMVASYTKYMPDNLQEKIYFKLNPFYCTKDAYTTTVTMVMKDGKRYVCSYTLRKTKILTFNEVIDGALNPKISFEVKITEEIRKRLL